MEALFVACFLALSAVALSVGIPLGKRIVDRRDYTAVTIIDARQPIVVKSVSDIKDSSGKAADGNGITSPFSRRSEERVC